MPDCSYVTLEVPEWAGPALTAIAARVAPDVETYDTSSAFAEAAYGFSDDDFTALADALTGAGIPWFAIDTGHYTWDPMVNWWAPGGDSGVEVSATQDGAIMADAYTVGKFLESPDPAAAAAHYFGAYERVITNSQAPGDLAERLAAIADHYAN